VSGTLDAGRGADARALHFPVTRAKMFMASLVDTDKPTFISLTAAAYREE
jgi:hypothetical protein